jgi:2-keto-4-pentenoate hydratase/2-oxohepta-3-ene-1,7-dioic acid hydratase in catechol pathway
MEALVKLVSYSRDGHATWGILERNDIIEGSTFSAAATLRDLLMSVSLESITKFDLSLGKRIPFDQVKLLPPIANPDKILCAGLNYASHIAETERKAPVHPRLFARLANTLLAHGDPMVRPRISTHFDYEGELAVIIGRAGRYISEADALSHVAGYTCFNDGSIRDFQEHSVTAGKNFPATGPLGPWMVTADEIPDPTRLHLTTRLNGEEVQSSATDCLIYSIPTLISYASSFTPLVPGDIIATGTPQGVGHRRSPQKWMKPGDVIEVEISGIGLLRNTIVDE